MRGSHTVLAPGSDRKWYAVREVPSSKQEAGPIWLRPSREPRAPRPSLGREEITRAAIELADSEGLEAVSMRRIATKLGAGATSLYWYIRSKEDLYELMADELIGEITLPKRPSGDWRADLRIIAIETRVVLSRHSWFPLLGIQPGLGPKTQRYGQVAGTMLRDTGLEPAEWIGILAALNNYVFGFVHRETAWKRLRRQSGLDDQEWRGRLDDIINRTAINDPGLAAEAATRMELHDDRNFLFGLDMFLDGIATRLRSSGPSSTSSTPSNFGSECSA